MNNTLTIPAEVQLLGKQVGELYSLIADVSARVSVIEGPKPDEAMIQDAVDTVMAQLNLLPVPDDAEGDEDTEPLDFEQEDMFEGLDFLDDISEHGVDTDDVLDACTNATPTQVADAVCDLLHELNTATKQLDAECESHDATKERLRDVVKLNQDNIHYSAERADRLSNLVSELSGSVEAAGQDNKRLQQRVVELTSVSESMLGGIQERDRQIEALNQRIAELEEAVPERDVNDDATDFGGENPHYKWNASTQKWEEAYLLSDEQWEEADASEPLPF